MTHASNASVVSILMTACETIEAIAGKGLAGDRYAIGSGYYSGDTAWDANVTLIQQESFDAINKGHTTNFTCEMLRRNIVTRNVKLISLVGRTFRIGDVVLKGVKEWPPCNYLAKMNDSWELKHYFAHCAGIGAIVVHGGTLNINDEIAVVDAADS
jgi:MOSC domain-containing protein YiiM